MKILWITRMASWGLLFASVGLGAPQQIPKTWDDADVAVLEVPLTNRAYSAVHISSADYYRLPARSVYKSYPIYASGKAPDGYLDWLKQQEPEIVFDVAKLTTETDWIRAGALVFDAPISYVPLSNSSTSTAEFWQNMPTARDGTLPFQQYVIRKQGVSSRSAMLLAGSVTHACCLMEHF